MVIREAAAEDNDELQSLQARCPMGTSLVVSAVNTPDFFARAKAYESCQIYAACDDDRIVGSAACAVRDALVGGQIRRVGYEFQYFTDPDRRRTGIAAGLHRHIVHRLIERGAALSYALIMEGNLPSMRLFEREGFQRRRTLVMPALAVFKEMAVGAAGTVRPAAPDDLAAVADLLNETWRGFELYKPTSAAGLARFVERTPAYDLGSFLVLEDRGRILACLGFWDWSRITRITVRALSLKLRIIGAVLGLAGHFTPMPRRIQPGQVLRQMVLTSIGLREPEHLAALLRHLNNLALRSGVEQIFSVSERDHPLLASMKGFIRIDTAIHLYVKPLQERISLGPGPVFVDGIDF